jgi:hypothetical protein
MIAACYSNPNWDGKDNADKRKQYLEDLNEHFNKAITAIYYPDGPREADVDWDNPFFAAHKREIERTRTLLVEQFGEKGQTAGEVLEAEQGSEQATTNGSSRYDDVDQIIPRNK